jgi:hypothetical protein
MNIKTEESFSEQYAIISYSHEDEKAVKSELDVFDKNGICYWFDINMKDGKAFDTQFFEILDNKNCKGIIFFISDAFLLSENCAREMEHFQEKYGVEYPDKFCLFVLPKEYPNKDSDVILAKIKQYVKNDPAKIEKLFDVNVKNHVKLFLQLNRDGFEKHVTLGNTDDYIGNNCEKGRLFYDAGIIFGHKQVSNVYFGYFPQKKSKCLDVLDNEMTEVQRNADKETAYYAPVEWIVIRNPDKSQTLLSKELLFAIDYLSLKYPYIKTDKKIEERIKELFLKYFRQGADKGEIKTVRFLLKDELNILKMRFKQNNKLRELLLPEATYFAEISNRKDAHAFWLAGDINDARRVDAATESLSEEEAGVELYYVRIVIEVEIGE